MSRYLKLSMIALLAVVCIVRLLLRARSSLLVVIMARLLLWAAWYGPGWGAPYGYYRGPVTGGVKFDTKMKDASVFVDGGYAGTVGKLKTSTAAGLVQYRTARS